MGKHLHLLDIFLFVVKWGYICCKVKKCDECSNQVKVFDRKLVFFIQIFDTLNRILQLDKSLEVRRAAVLVITLILQGLGGDAFRVLESVLRDIW